MDTNVIAGALMRAAERGEGISVGLGGHEPEDGYMVGISGFEWRVPAASAAAAVDAYVTAYADLLGAGVYVGLWYDDDYAYLDISTRYTNHDTAMQAGREFGQIAIWDVERGEEVRLQP